MVNFASQSSRHHSCRNPKSYGNEHHSYQGHVTNGYGQENLIHFPYGIGGKTFLHFGQRDTSR